MGKFTIEEFRKYLLSKDSFGDALYHLNEDNIDKANIKWTQEGLLEDEDGVTTVYSMSGISPLGKKYTATGTYNFDDLETIEYIEEA